MTLQSFATQPLSSRTRSCHPPPVWMTRRRCGMSPVINMNIARIADSPILAGGHIASTSGDFSTVGYFDAWRMCICHGDYSKLFPLCCK